MTRPPYEIKAVIALKRAGATDRQISQLTGVPVETIRTWRQRGIPVRARRRPGGGCPRCGGELHDLVQHDEAAYAYLLGVYLGDGWLSAAGGSSVLNVALDTAYPGIIARCRDAIATVNGGRPPWVTPYPGGKNCVRIGSGWKRWPCLFPQHGPGRKHHRRIELAAWQREIVRAQPGQLLRGLIETDGWRGLNRVFVKGRWYAYPRYQFSNRSDDIRRIFTDTCDLMGVPWRPWGRYHVSVARREAVARLDEFIGPKA